MQPEFLDQKQSAGYNPLPPDLVLTEAAYLVARGVRPLALVGICAESDAPAARHRLLTLGQAGTITFAASTGDGGAACGYASHAWAIDLYAWANTQPTVQRDRILGLLLGYSPQAIRSFEELAHGVSP